MFHDSELVAPCDEDLAATIASRPCLALRSNGPPLPSGPAGPCGPVCPIWFQVSARSVFLQGFAPSSVSRTAPLFVA